MHNRKMDFSFTGGRAASLCVHRLFVFVTPLGVLGIVFWCC